MTKRVRTNLCLAIVLGLLAMLAIGCAARPADRVTLPDPKAGESLQRGMVRVDDARAVVERASGQAPKDLRPLLVAAIEGLRRASLDFVEAGERYLSERLAAQKAIDEQQAIATAEQKARVELEAKWYVEGGRVIDRWWRALRFWTIWGPLVGIPISVLALLITGPAGPIVAVAGRVLGGPIVLVYTVIENVFWRRIRGAAAGGSP